VPRANDHWFSKAVAKDSMRDAESCLGLPRPMASPSSTRRAAAVVKNQGYDAFVPLIDSAMSDVESQAF
jgi:hypothetical protein